MGEPGHIKRQSFLNLIATYLGVALGFLNMGVLMPKFFSTTEVGLINFIISTGMLLATTFKFGASNIAIRFFPYFRDDKENNGFFSLLAIISIVTSLVFLTAFVLFGDWFLGFFDASSPLVRQYAVALIPTTIGMLLYENYSAYSRANLRSTIPNFIKEVVFRGLVFVAIMLFVFQVITYSSFVWLFSAIYIVLIVLLWINLASVGLFRFTPINFKVPLKEIITYGFFALLNGGSIILVQSIDKIMITQMFDLKATGVYSIAFLFGSVIQAPFRSMASIMEPILARALKDEEYDKVGELYKKSSLSLYVIGSFFFLLIFCNAHNIFKFLPDEYAAGIWVVLFIGLAKVFDMLTSANSLIIVNSSFYKLDLVSNLVLVVLTIVTNLIFIPIWGINGAAIATMLSIIAVNILKCIMVWYKMRIQPIGKGIYITTLLAIVTFAVGYFLPRFDNLFIDTAYRSLIIAGIFGSVTVHFKISPEVNDFVRGKLPEWAQKYIR